MGRRLAAVPGGVDLASGAAGVADDEFEGEGILSAIDLLLPHESDGGLGEELAVFIGWVRMVVSGGQAKAALGTSS